jgi:hypothetical protein
VNTSVRGRPSFVGGRTEAKWFLSAADLLFRLRFMLWFSSWARAITSVVHFLRSPFTSSDAESLIQQGGDGRYNVSAHGVAKMAGRRERLVHTCAIRMK